MSLSDKDCNYQVSSTQLKTYSAFRNNVQVRVDSYGVLDNISVKFTDGLTDNLIRLDRDEAICLSKALDLYVKSLD